MGFEEQRMRRRRTPTEKMKRIYLRANLFLAVEMAMQKPNQARRYIPTNRKIGRFKYSIPYSKLWLISAIAVKQASKTTPPVKSIILSLFTAAAVVAIAKGFEDFSRGCPADC
jgi:hypothetical protein